MQSSKLSSSAPRAPRPWAQFRHPVLGTLFLVVSASLSCAASQAPSSSHSTALTTRSESISPSPTPTTLVIPSPEMQWMAQGPNRPAEAKTTRPRNEAPAFSEDNQNLPSVICAGGCPLSYQLGADSKDQDQVRARIRYCIENNQPPLDAEGTMFVRIEINGKGIGKSLHYRPTLNRGTVPESVRECIDSLVRTARFHAESNYSRQHDVAYELKL